MIPWAHIGLAGSFGALLVGWLMVVVRGLYLGRHLFTLNNCQEFALCGPEKGTCVKKQSSEENECLVACDGLYADISDVSLMVKGWIMFCSSLILFTILFFLLVCFQVSRQCCKSLREMMSFFGLTGKDWIALVKYNGYSPT